MSNILIGVTGGISAYKIPSAVSVLVDKGHDVRDIMTEAAKKFIAPLTFSALSHNPVFDDSKEFNGNDGHIWHVELAKWADVFAIAPMTANTGSKITHTIADNLLTSTALVYQKRLLMFPAMNVHMWERFKYVFLSHNSVVHKLYWDLEVAHMMLGDIGEGKLVDTKLIVSLIEKDEPTRIMVQPASGKMACGDIGEGKLVDTKLIVSLIEKVISISNTNRKGRDTNHVK